MQFSQDEISEIDNLIQEGFKRLDRIEDDIRALMTDSDDITNPFAETIKTALDAICPETQFLTIKRARAGLKLVRAKMEIDEFSDSDAEEVCRVLDDLKVLGRLLAGASQTYKQHLRQRAENN